MRRSDRSVHGAWLGNRTSLHGDGAVPAREEAPRFARAQGRGLQRARHAGGEQGVRQLSRGPGPQLQQGQPPRAPVQPGGRGALQHQSHRAPLVLRRGDRGPGERSGWRGQDEQGRDGAVPILHQARDHRGPARHACRAHQPVLGHGKDHPHRRQRGGDALHPRRVLRVRAVAVPGHHQHDAPAADHLPRQPLRHRRRCLHDRGLL
mmetsp:Transcript_31130/g.101414  ORF Transcript_31130/g.101414 Transcript_31130/m.101414 type:complete len:206 (+) Transcript_31130:548-1165(+)